MNKHSRCVTSFDRWDRPAPEQCIVVKGTEYLSLEVIKPWPVCENGTEAKFALFGTMSGTCDPKQDQLGILRPLLSKSDVLFKCVDLLDVGSFAWWCDGVKPLPPLRTRRKRVPWSRIRRRGNATNHRSHLQWWNAICLIPASISTKD